jgi:hypothetical protein
MTLPSITVELLTGRRGGQATNTDSGSQPNQVSRRGGHIVIDGLAAQMHDGLPHHCVFPQEPLSRSNDPTNTTGQQPTPYFIPVVCSPVMLLRLCGLECGSWPFRPSILPGKLRFLAQRHAREVRERAGQGGEAERAQRSAETIPPTSKPRQQGFPIFLLLLALLCLLDRSTFLTRLLFALDPPGFILLFLADL